MGLEVLSKSRIDNLFLIEVIDCIDADASKVRTEEQKSILKQIREDILYRVKHGTFRQGLPNYAMQENEYNFLVQNDKKVWCDYLIFRYRFEVYPKLKKLTDIPSHVILEPVSYCNLRCTMCFQIDETFTKDKALMGAMDLDLFKRIIDQMVDKGSCSLTLAARGEPTLHPQFGELLAYAKGKFFDFKMNTNATRLTEEKCHQILQGGVTELVFSVDSYFKEEYESIRKGAKFEKVLENIMLFKKIRQEQYPQSKCRTRISGVKVNPYMDTEKFVEFWSQYVDFVGCVPNVDRWDTYNNPPSNRKTPCQILWQRMYIWYDGGANPCDYDYKGLLKVGNLKEENIADIWKSDFYGQLRSNHLTEKRACHKPCDRCSY